MMRLIDADALPKYTGYALSADEVAKAVETAPTIDAVEVVLCKYCIHGITGHGIADGWVLCSKPYATDTVGGAMHRCDWFCGDGNRKEKNDENPQHKIEH